MKFIGKNALITGSANRIGKEIAIYLASIGINVALHYNKSSDSAINTLEEIKKHKIISCPGCYPTSIQLPLIPLIRDRMINVKNIIVDSKSGFSGAGKRIKKRFTHKYLYESVAAYGVGSHRHMAEIDQELSKYSKSEIKVSFTPHLTVSYTHLTLPTKA